MWILLCITTNNLLIMEAPLSPCVNPVSSRFIFTFILFFFVTVGTKVWDVDGPSGVTSDAFRRGPEEGGSGALQHGRLTSCLKKGSTLYCSLVKMRYWEVTFQK